MNRLKWTMSWGIQIVLIEVGATSNPNPNEEKKAKVPKTRSMSFPTFEDVLLVKSLLTTSMDPIGDKLQKSASIGRRSTSTIMSRRNVISLQHRWSTIPENVNKFVGQRAFVLGRNQSGIEVQTHIS